MSGYQAGDDITLRCVVVPEDGVPTDGTTTATVRAVCSDGTISEPTAVPNEDRSSWRATLKGAAAGEWRITWTITGTGSGVQSDTLVVASLPQLPARGRAYATVADLDDPPTNAARMLVRASRRVDELVRCAVYDVDDAGLPTSPLVADALRDATVAQVEWWAELGDETGSGGVAALAGAQIGTVKLPGGGGGASGSGIVYAPEAISILGAAGLSTQGPRIPGPPRGDEWA